MSAPTYHGMLEGVELADGTYRPLARVALGSMPGRGLVVGRSPQAVIAGYVYPNPPGRYRPIRAVYYWRRRPGGSRWRHELSSTAYAEGPRGPAFVSLSPKRAARVCAYPPGEFICEG